MKEQEWYKHLLEKLITDTENQKINTSDEMINTLIREISLTKGNHGMAAETETITK